MNSETITSKGFGDRATFPHCFDHPHDPNTNISDEPWKVFECVDCDEEVELWETCESWQLPIFCEHCDGDLQEL